MNDDDLSPAAEPRVVTATPALEAPAAGPPSTSTPTSTPVSPWRWAGPLLAVLALVAIGALYFAYRADQRVRSSERELVRRQEDSAERVSEGNMLARQAQEGARDATAKVALLEARLNEVAIQRSQLEELIQSVARSRDENLVADIEAALRAAVQQANLTGSAEAVVEALKQGDERLARADQPRLEPVRRAIAHDLERVKLANMADVATLSIRLDEATRMVDELPLLSAAEPRRDLARGATSTPAPRSDAAAPSAASPASAAASQADGVGTWVQSQLGRAGHFLADSVWTEVRSLVRVTRIDHPEAMLVAPDQAYFLRENLKLRLLNARLALLARQPESAQGDLKIAQASVERYFDRSSRRTQAAIELLHQVAEQTRQVSAARPDDTFTALAAVSPRR